MEITRLRISITLLCLGAAALAGCASTTPDSYKGVQPVGLQKEETSIPFARMEQSIHDWQANGQVGLWIQDGRRDWYYATTLGPCYGLDWAVGIGIEPRGSQLDKFGYVLVPRYRSRCPFTSFVRSDAPPPDAKKKPASEDEADKAGAPKPPAESAAPAK